MSDQLKQIILKESMKKFRELEEEGRSIASDRDGAVGHRDSVFLKGLIKSSQLIYEYYVEEGQMRNPEHMFIGDFAWDIFSATNFVLQGEEDCREKGVNRVGCALLGNDKEALLRIDKTLKKHGEQRCTWLLDPYADKPYHLALAENDLTTCFHRLIDKVSSEMETWDRDGKCMWRK